MLRVKHYDTLNKKVLAKLKKSIKTYFKEIHDRKEKEKHDNEEEGDNEDRSV